MTQLHLKQKEIEEIRRLTASKDKAIEIIKNLAVRMGIVKGVAI